MAESFLELDVRPILNAGGEPFGKIMEAVNALKPGQSLKLIATFKPVPLFAVMDKKGYAHEEKEIGGGDWEVLFRPDAAKTPAAPEAPAQSASAADAASWPAPANSMDNRDLDPPEPMVRVLAGLEELQQGQVLEALLCREPVFLLPELKKRGHAWKGGFDANDSKTYRIRILVGGGQ